MLINRRCPKGRLGILGLAGLGLVASLFFGFSSALGHEGHDHGEADKPAVVSSAYPRVAARSELYEVVGILKDGKLSVFIDDATTNEPVSDAALQITLGESEPVNAENVGKGVYSAGIPSGTPSGSVEVIYSVCSLLIGDNVAAAWLPRSAP